MKSDIDKDIAKVVEAYDIVSIIAGNVIAQREGENPLPIINTLRKSMKPYIPNYENYKKNSINMNEWGQYGPHFVELLTIAKKI